MEIHPNHVRATCNGEEQAGQSRTISEVLSSQSGRLWYGLKAQPRPARLWLRKGVGGVFAPFIFQTPQVVDQRCNYVVAKDGITEEELAAVLTSTCFAFSAEVNGSTSMGVIELATSKLKGYPVLAYGLVRAGTVPRW